jgi:hypothetical protein
MDRSRGAYFGLAAFFLGCSAGGGSSGSLVVGKDGSGGFSGGPPGTGGELVVTKDGGYATPLSAHVENAKGVTVTFVTLTCSDACAEVRAVASGGFAPYQYRWEDGSTNPERNVCPTSTTDYQVTVTDAGTTSAEFMRASQTVTAPLTANVIHCPVDAGPPPPVDAGCTVGAAADLPEPLTLDVMGSVRYFAKGAPLPRGKYRIEYVDGCMMYGPATSATGTWGWEIHTGNQPFNLWLTGFPGAGYCVLVGASASNILQTLPGITSGAPGYSTYADCVAANKSTNAPLDFDFAGGPLGIVVKDALPSDNSGGETAGGVSPTWKLSLVAACQ